MRRRRAFSFIELVIVLAISAIVAAIAIPRIGNAASRYNADFCASKICLDFEQARTNARLTGVTQSITFNLSQHSYSITGATTGITAASTVQLAANPYNARVLSANFNGSNSASFTPYGECVSGGTVTIKAGTSTRTITLDDASGKARWQ